ncbi:tectonin domain-containing protein, partial [Candidatus Riflebacteria bacterium]
VNRAGMIYVMDVKRKAWRNLPGRAKDIGCGGPGQGVTCIIGTNKHTYKWDGKKWIDFGGSAKRVDVDKHGNPWVVNDGGVIYWYEVKAKQWHHMPTGRAIDIACGPDGTLWVLGTDKTVWKWNGKTWVKGNGMGYHITVDNKGLPWVIGMDRGTWTRAVITPVKPKPVKPGVTPVKPVKPVVKPVKAGGQPPAGVWKKLPGAGMDIGVGANGVAWCVGTNQAPYRWDGRAWRKYPGGIVKVDVDPKGQPWGVNRAGMIYVMDVKRKAWRNLPGRAKDIGCGGPGQGVTCIIGTNKHTYKWDGRKWIDFGGAAKRVDVDKHGNPWVVNDGGVIYRYEVKAKKWVHIKTGRAIDIACGPDGTIWVLGTDKTVWKWNGKTWIKGNGMGYHITVDNRGLPWVVGMDKGTWMRTK